jgi:hypothetical protein
VRLLIKKLWKMVWDQWDHRNDVLHPQDNMVSQDEADMMNSQIRDCFSIGSQGFLSQDRYLFTGHTRCAALLWSPRHNNAWLKLAENANRARQENLG